MKSRFTIEYFDNKRLVTKPFTKKEVSKLSRVLARQQSFIQKLTFSNVDFTDQFTLTLLVSTLDALKKNSSVISLNFSQCTIHLKDFNQLISSLITISLESLKNNVHEDDDARDSTLIRELKENRNHTLHTVTINDTSVLFLGLSVNKLLKTLELLPIKANQYERFRLNLLIAEAMIDKQQFLEAIPYLINIRSELLLPHHSIEKTNQLREMLERLCFKLGDWYAEQNAWHNAKFWYLTAYHLNLKMPKSDYKLKNLVTYTIRIIENLNNINEFENLSRAIDKTVHNMSLCTDETHTFARSTLFNFCFIQNKSEEDVKHAAIAARSLSHFSKIFAFIYEALFHITSKHFSFGKTFQECCRHFELGNDTKDFHLFMNLLNFAIEEHSNPLFPSSPIKSYLNHDSKKKSFIRQVNELKVNISQAKQKHLFFPKTKATASSTMQAEQKHLGVSQNHKSF